MEKLSDDLIYYIMENNIDINIISKYYVITKNFNKIINEYIKNIIISNYYLKLEKIYENNKINNNELKKYINIIEYLIYVKKINVIQLCYDENIKIAIYINESKLLSTYRVKISDITSYYIDKKKNIKKKLNNFTFYYEIILNYVSQYMQSIINEDKLYCNNCNYIFPSKNLSKHIFLRVCNNKNNIEKLGKPKYIKLKNTE